MTKNFKFQVVDSEVKIDSNEFISTLKNLKDGDYVITVKKQKKPRSLSQNRYYHGVVIKILSEETGFTPIEMHEALKRHFLGVEDYFGISVAKSTTNTSTVSFEDYLSQVRMWASKELGCFIPEPNSPDLDFYFN